MSAWQRALVTGASSGIGRAIATELASRGSDVVLVARRRAMLNDLAATLANEHGVKAEVLAADLTAPEGLAAVEECMRDEGAPIDLLVNNAGFGSFGTLWTLPVERELEQIQLNVAALLRLTHSALAIMVPRGRGGVLNVSSVASFQPMPRNATYSATKAFVTSFTQAAHLEARGKGVHVSALCPGFVRTEFQQVADAAVDTVPGRLWLDVGVVARAGLDAVTANQPVAIPGAAYKTVTALSRTMPMGMVRRMVNGLSSARSRRG